MTAEIAAANVELVRAGFEAFNAGDADGCMALADSHRRLARQLFAELSDDAFTGFDAGLRHVIARFRGVLADQTSGQLQVQDHPRLTCVSEARPGGRARGCRGTGPHPPRRLRMAGCAYRGCLRCGAGQFSQRRPLHRPPGCQLTVT